MQTIRWKQRFENYDKAFIRLSEAAAALEKEPQNRLYEMAIIQAFEFTLELGWKVLKDYLSSKDVKDANFPRDVIKQAFHFELIPDGQVWIDMLEARNKTSYTYDDIKAAEIAQQIQKTFLPALQQLHADFQGKL